MEACGGVHYWAREIQALGHEVQLIPPQYVKPFVLGHKSDARDARAIANRTALGNELHGLLAEMGIIVAKGHSVFRHGEVRRLLADHRAALGDDLFVVLDDVLDQWLALDARIRAYDQRLARLAKTTPVCQRLMSVPGIGPVNATLLASHIGDPGRFANGRAFSASIGLVPRQHSSGGKGAIDEHHRAGATARCVDSSPMVHERPCALFSVSSSRIGWHVGRAHWRHDAGLPRPSLPWQTSSAGSVGR